MCIRDRSHGRTVEVMETDEKSQGFNELATINPKPKDDGSSNLNPLNPLQSAAPAQAQRRISVLVRTYVRTYCGKLPINGQ